MNNRKTGLILSYTETVVNMVCGLFLSSFLLRVLGDFEYGLYQTMSAFVSYLVILEFGTGTVMCRHLLVAKETSDPERKNKITATLWYITLVLGVLILAVGTVFAFSIRKIYVNTIPAEQMSYAVKIFSVMLLYLLFSFFNQTLSGTFIGNENYNIGNIIQISRILCRAVILTVAVVSVKLSIVIAICDAVISFAVLMFTAVYVKRKYAFSFRLRDFDRDVLRDSLPLCIALLLQTVINQANNNVDKFIISIRMNMESVSLYSVAMYIFAMFSSITTKPITMYMPQVAENMRKGLRGKALAKSLVPSGRLVALVGGTVVFGFAVVGRQFIEIVYGKEYTMAWVVALILLVPAFVNMTGGNVENVLDVLNKRQVRSYMLTLTTAINIVLTVWFVGFWGIIGAAVATAISIALGHLTFLNIYYYKALSMNIWALYIDSYKGIVPAQIIAALIGMASCFFIENKYVSFAVGGVVFVVAEFVFLMLFGFNEGERKNVKKLFCKIKKLKK